MEGYVVSAALFVVILLLSAVVYDGLVQQRKIRRLRAAEQDQGKPETTDDNVSRKKRSPMSLLSRVNGQIPGTVSLLKKAIGPVRQMLKRGRGNEQKQKERIASEIALPVNDGTSGISANEDVNAPEETEEPISADTEASTPTDPVADLLGRIESGDYDMAPEPSPGDVTPTEEGQDEEALPVVNESTDEVEEGNLVRGSVEEAQNTVDQWVENSVQEVDAASAPVTAGMLQSAVDELTGRLGNVEESMDRIGQLEEGLTRVSEETGMVSEEMKDILGTLRTSIDGLESRLNEMSSETRESEEENERITNLEETVTSIKDSIESIKPLTEDIQKAMNNSAELGQRLDVVAANLQSTMGYGMQKSFRCDSCGSAGFVASQVTCSKCGNESWWGWWPQSEAEDDTNNEPAETVNTEPAAEDEPVTTGNE